MAKRGVTQELIEETRALPETQMLQDIQTILAKGGELESRDVDQATPVSTFLRLYTSFYLISNPISKLLSFLHSFYT